MPAISNVVLEDSLFLRRSSVLFLFLPHPTTDTILDRGAAERAVVDISIIVEQFSVQFNLCSYEDGMRIT